MKVWIVAKLHRDYSFSIHGLTENNENVRFSPKDNDPSILSSFKVGDIWDIDYENNISPWGRPYTENRIIDSHRYIGREQHIRNFLLERVKFGYTGIRDTFLGRLERGKNGALFASNWGNVVPISIGYWVTDQALKRVDSRQGYFPTYQYNEFSTEQTEFRSASLTIPIDYTGFEPEIPIIPVQTLVLLSLKSPWALRETQIYNNPLANKVAPKRSYLEIGKWFL